MGISGTAPAFSAATTTSALIAAVGAYSASIVFYSGLTMFGITFAFMYLNRISANAGAAYAWVSDVFHKDLGFLAGWSVLVASALFMVSGTIPTATSTLAIFYPEMVNDTVWVTAISALWLTFISLVILKGIKPTSFLQIVFTILELLIFSAIIIAAFVYFFKNPVNPVGLYTLNPFNFTLEAFSKGALISLFFFWGWDVTMNLNEETASPTEAPGRAAFISMIIITLIFVSFALCATIALTDAEIQKAGTNVLLHIANKLFPEPWGNIAIIAVVLSSLGTIETSILQFTRTLFAKSRDGALHKRWSKIHHKWKTPWTATLLIWAFGMVFLLAASFKTSIAAIIDISIEVISFQVAYYYSMCALACAWYHRSLAKSNFPLAIVTIIWPCFSAIALITIAVYGAVNTFSPESVTLGIGGIAVGIIPLLINKYIKRRQLHA